MAEFYRIGVATVLAADAELDAGAGLTALIIGDLHELANTGLVDRGEWVLGHDLVLRLGA